MSQQEEETQQEVETLPPLDSARMPASPNLSSNLIIGVAVVDFVGVAGAAAGTLLTKSLAESPSGATD